MLQAAIIAIIALIACIETSPTPTTVLTSSHQTPTPQVTTTTTTAALLPSNPIRADSETLSLEGLDYLLRRAEKLFRTANYNEQSAPLPQPYLRLNERLQPPPTDEPFSFYLPLYRDDDHANFYPNTEKIDLKAQNLLKFSPPPVQKSTSNEHNYYAAKPKKIPKKYSAAVKHVNIKSHANPKIYNEWDAIFGNSNGYEDDQDNHKIIYDDSYFGINSNLPAVPEIIPQDYFHNGRGDIRKSLVKDIKVSANIDGFDDREDGEKDLPIVLPNESQKNIESSDGPKSYKFGYDTGKGKDRQFRFEERNDEGNVKGQYGYTDENGKMKIVKYSSTADKGFQIVY